MNSKIMIVTLLLLITPSGYASFISSINKVMEQITPVLEDLFFDAEEITKKRESDYVRYIDELSNIDAPDAFKSRTFEILNKLKDEDEQLSEQLKRIEGKVSDLRVQENKYQEVIVIAQKEQQELQRKQDLYITGILGAGTAAILAIIGLLVRIPTILLERKALKLDIELKIQEIAHNKISQTETSKANT